MPQPRRYHSNAERQAAYRRRNPQLSGTHALRLCRQLQHQLEHLAQVGDSLGEAAYHRNLQRCIERLDFELDQRRHPYKGRTLTPDPKRKETTP